MTRREKEAYFAQSRSNVNPFRINTFTSVAKQRILTGSVDILVEIRVPQAVEVISQAEQRGLADLRTQGAARSAGDRFDLDAFGRLRNHILLN